MKKQFAWPDTVGICCACFEPIGRKELFMARKFGRTFHNECFVRGGKYARLEARLARIEMAVDRLAALKFDLEQNGC